MTFFAQTSDGEVFWTNDEWYLGGSPIAIVKILTFADGTPRLLSPTGPEITPDVSNPVDMALTIEHLYPDAKFSGDVPDTTKIFPPEESGWVY